MQTQNSMTGKKVWVRPEVTGTASLEGAQANKFVTGTPEQVSNNVTTGPAS